jgi:hypothetical protein
MGKELHLLTVNLFFFESVGMSPYRAPATYNLLQYTELAQGKISVLARGNHLHPHDETPLIDGNGIILVM